MIGALETVLRFKDPLEKVFERGSMEIGKLRGVIFLFEQQASHHLRLGSRLSMDA